MKPAPWPAKLELEKWLMNTAKDADPSSCFLRKMLQMNPSYGSYLVGDEDFAGIVQLFAKRFRDKVIGSERVLREDPTGKSLYEPLCEISWRVIGHLFHSIMDLEEPPDNFPMPKEALGQVKMLLQTNVVLSKKFNDMRRAYLRELSSHRDRQRVLTEKAQAAVNTLHEHPVMFYEPLEFVLDDVTKQFIQEVVEERLKLDMQGVKVTRTTVQQNVPAVDVEDPEKARMYAEMRQLRNNAAKNEAQAEKAAQECARAKAMTEKFKEQAEQAEAKADELRKQLEALMKQPQKVEVVSPKPQPKVERPQEAPRVEVEIVEREVIKEVIIEKIVQAPAPPAKGESEDLKKLRKRNAELEEEKQELADELERVRRKHAEPVVIKQETKQVVKEVIRPEIIKETQVVIQKDSSADELRKQLQKHLDIEKELRQANQSLEKALSESKEKAKYRGPKGEPKNIDVEIAQTVTTIIEDHSEKLQAQADEIKHLKRLLAEAKEAHSQPKPQKVKVVPQPQEPEKKPKRVKEEVVVLTDDGDDKAQKWKAKYAELEDKHEDLQGEYDKLEEQVRILLEKIKKYGGEAAVQEVLHEIKLKPPPPRKRRRKKAYERLYEDAQRRIMEMRARALALEKQEKKLLFHAAARVTDRKSLRQVENLTHLYKASMATQSRFHDALSRFHQEHDSGPDFGDSSGTDDEDDVLPALEAYSPPSMMNSGDLAGFLGVQSVPLNRSTLKLAESGMHLGSSLSSTALGLSAGVGGKHFNALHEERSQRSNSPNSQSPPHRKAPPPVLSSQPTFNQLRARKLGGEPPGTREPPLSAVEYARQIRTPSPSSRDSGTPNTSPAPPWRRAPTDAALAGGQTLGALLQRPIIGAHAATWTPGELGAAAAASRDWLQGRNLPPLLGTSGLAAARSTPALLGGSAPWRSPRMHNAPADHARPATASVLAAPAIVASGLSLVKTAAAPAAAAGEVGTGLGQGGNKGPKRRSLGVSKEDCSMLNAPVKARTDGFCVTAMRSQEHLLAMAAAQSAS